jgi:hypothetical protein
VNVPPLIGTLISANRASLVELQSVLGVRDAYELLEIVMVDAENAARAREVKK